MPGTFAIALVTAGSEAKGREIAVAALDARLAACVQIHPMKSYYVWNGALCEEGEVALTLKIRAEDFAALSALVRSLHDYEVPEILKLDVADGDPAYLDWLAAATKRSVPS